jgi:ribosome-associated protein
MDTPTLPPGLPYLGKEMNFQATRSSGPGGQHVNKVSTRVELRFNIPASELLSEQQKEVLLRKLSGKLTKEGELIVSSEETRSQKRNKEDCISKFYELLGQALKPPKKRLRTRPTAASRKKSLEGKKQQAEKKARRKFRGE